MEIKLEDIFYPKKLWKITPGFQIFLVALLFTIYILVAYFNYQTTGTMFGYPLSISILFVPIYEEIIFRGLILFGLMKYYSWKKAIVISSLLFGLWHLKNIFFISQSELIYQMLYITTLRTLILRRRRITTGARLRSWLGTKEQ